MSTEIEDLDLTEVVRIQIGQIKTLQDIIERQAQITQAARHLLRVFDTLASEGIPLFKWNEEHDPADFEVCRHAIVSLGSLLEGEPIPNLALPEVTH